MVGRAFFAPEARARIAHGESLLSGGVNPLEPVLIEFPAQHLPRLLDRGDPVPHTCSYQVILNPAVRSLDLALGRWTQGIDNLDAQILQHRLPLYDDVLFLGVRLLPDRIAFLDKPEDRVVIDVVLQRTAHACDQSLDGDDMRPGAFALPQVRIQEIATMIVNGGDQIPLGRRLRGPKMIRRIVLNQLPHIVGQDFPIMGLAVRTLQVIPIFFSRRMMVGRDTKTWCFFSSVSFR